MLKLRFDEDNPVRLDRFLRRNFPSLTQGLIEKLLRGRKILVNNCKAKSSDRLKNGDEILIDSFLSEKLQESKTVSRPASFSHSIISLAKKIQSKYLILETEDFLAINKPFGLAVQGGSKIGVSVDAAINYLDDRYKIVHRLDKNTSGVLIIAKNHQTSQLFANCFKEKLLQKTYMAITCGVPALSVGIVENYIGKERSGLYEVVTENPQGKMARTGYEVLKKKDGFALVKYIPYTGRMHQLRVHSQKLGCPILGDVKYGGQKFERMMLHANRLVVPKNVFGKEYIIHAEFDMIFTNFLTKHGFENLTL